ncbi:MAG: hypothetical protein ACI9E1_000821 [Cryomorphaceae bacterium]|jgi:hypothetical protein
MFICIYKDSNQLINSVHHYWIHQRAVLKNHAHKDSLLCQMCNEPLKNVKSNSAGSLVTTVMKR